MQTRLNGGKEDFKQRNNNQDKGLNAVALAFLSILVGMLCGFGAVLFRGLIAFFHNLLFLGRISFFYNANIHTPASYLGPFVILVPVAGVIGVVLLINHLAPEAKGKGVTEVIDAIFYHEGEIRPIVGIVKSIASALSIGSGGSLGREGPIIQIGASLSSSVSQILSLPSWQRVAMVAAGAGAGIAATFNTPIGGVFFAIEIMTKEVSVRTTVPIILAAASGVYTSRFFFGAHPPFALQQFISPGFQQPSPPVMLAYLGLGILAGVSSILFIRSASWMEDLFDLKFKINIYVRYALGIVIAGIIYFLILELTGHYYVEGVGYAAIQDILRGLVVSPVFLAVLFVTKLAVTTLALGAGGSGGVFSPGLFLGASLGSLYGTLLKQIFPGLGISAPEFAVVGMAAVIGGSTGAVVTSIIMVLEMTLDYHVALPLMAAVAISYGLRKLLIEDSIYTYKLFHNKHPIPHALLRSVRQTLVAEEIMATPVHVLPFSKDIYRIAAARLKDGIDACLVVEKEGRIVGAVTRQSIAAVEGPFVEDTGFIESISSRIIIKSFITTERTMPLQKLYRRMCRQKATTAFVLDPLEGPEATHIIGVISFEMFDKYFD